MQIPRLRWWIVTLVALATVINYIDRQSLNVLWPEISAELYPDRTEDQRKEIYALISVIFVFPRSVVPKQKFEISPKSMSGEMSVFARVSVARRAASI